MRHTFRAVLLWAFVMYLGALAFVAQGQQLSQNPAKQQPQTTSSAPSEIDNPPAAVVIDDRPIFYLNAPVGAYTAADRAAAIQQRILDLAKSGDVPVESSMLRSAQNGARFGVGMASSWRCRTWMRKRGDGRGNNSRQKMRKSSGTLRGAIGKHTPGRTCCWACSTQH